MSSKKVPVRIGLTKKTADQSDISDLMSASTMEALEEFVEEALSDEDLHELPELEDEIERDADPDYVPCRFLYLTEKIIDIDTIR